MCQSGPSSGLWGGAVRVQAALSCDAGTHCSIPSQARVQSDGAPHPWVTTSTQAQHTDRRGPSSATREDCSCRIDRGTPAQHDGRSREEESEAVTRSGAARCEPSWAGGDVAQKVGVAPHRRCCSQSRHLSPGSVGHEQPASLSPSTRQHASASCVRVGAEVEDCVSSPPCVASKHTG